MAPSSVGHVKAAKSRFTSDSTDQQPQQRQCIQQRTALQKRLVEADDHGIPGGGLDIVVQLECQLTLRKPGRKQRCPATILCRARPQADCLW